MRYAPSFLLTALVAVGLGNHAAAQQPPLAGAFNSIFSPQKAPEKKAMGLLQRNFLDLVEESQDKLQVALVIDGTDSMAADMEGVRASMNAMMTDLRRYKGNNVEFCVVVYRDSGSPSGEVTLLLNQFTSDDGALSAAIAKLKPESGAPYFPELADLGVHEAITKLPWSEEQLTTRWILLVGDAPPYDPDFAEADTKARRRYDTDLLVTAARRKNITINSILCTSDQLQDEAYQKSLPQTRRFMSVLSTQTGGLMLDLSYPDIRQALIDANMQQRMEVTEIGTITPEDVSAARQQPPLVPEALDMRDGKRVSVAVLPHTTLAKMNFEPEQDAVQVAAEMRLKLRQLPQVEVRSPVEVERQVRRLQAQNLTDAQFVQALAVRLRVDCVVWGDIRRDGNDVQLTSAMYRKEDGQKLADITQLAKANLAAPQGEVQPETTLVGSATGKLLLTSVSNTTGGGTPTMNASFRSFTQDPAAMKQLQLPVAANPAIRSNLLHGMETLEQAMAYPVGDPQAESLLQESAVMLEKVIAEEARNAMAQFLLASCYANQANALQKKGDMAAATEAMKLSGKALKRAYSFRTDAQNDSLRTEIEGDYALLVKADPAEAITHYEKLAAGDTTRTASLRGNWMLAGIYTGDWEVPAEVIDPVQARKYLIKILAHWPDSPEAEFIRKNLRWDETKGNQYKYMPKENTGLLTAMR